MKKLLLTTLMMSALGTAAQAGSIGLDARADYEATTYNDAAKAAGNLSNYNRFNLQTLRVDYKGNFDEATSFRLRFRLNKGTSLATTNKRDSVNDAIDFAYVQRKLIPDLNLAVGKFATDIGGNEGLTSGADMYFTSAAYGEQNAFRYGTGAKLLYTFMDQEIDLMVSNQQTDAVNESSQFNQTREGSGLVYKGSFLDKSLSPILSWHRDSIQPSGATGAASRLREANYYAAGLKYDFAPLFVELDYLYDTWKDQSVQDETDKTTSAVATVGARLDNWVGKLKYESSEVETFSAASTSAKDKYNGYQVAAEYLSSSDKTLRYHVAYMSRDTKPATGDTRNTQSVYAGVRILADFLK